MLLNIFETIDGNIDYRRIEELFAWLNGEGCCMHVFLVCKHNHVNYSSSSWGLSPRLFFQGIITSSIFVGAYHPFLTSSGLAYIGLSLLSSGRLSFVGL